MSIYQLVASNEACRKHLYDDKEVRFYPIIAPQNVDAPYSTYQEIAGQPLNNITCPPKIDRELIQIDVYSKVYEEAKEIAETIRKAIEKNCYITSFRGVTQEVDTELYRVSFDTSWLINRKEEI